MHFRQLFNYINMLCLQHRHTKQAPNFDLSQIRRKLYIDAHSDFQ